MEIFQPTQIYKVECLNGNTVYIKRDDLLPYSFGGNKARKASLFFKEIEVGGYNAVVTYGSGGSNHCRIVANMAAERKLICHIISPDTESNSLNRRMVEMFGAKITSCAVDKVADTIDNVINSLKKCGLKPYFIPGGGHGNIGTHAYDLAYDEIKQYEFENKLTFDFIFFASGTGTTHAGLVCGLERYGDKKQIVGISIARKNPRGKQVVLNSITDYLGYCNEDHVNFDDNYICGGYGLHNTFIDHTICRMMIEHGIPLDSTYTGKAYAGMEQYLKEHRICGKNILFIHTGGTPIFCDWLVSNT